MSDVLVTGGSVVDGTGAPAYTADVRVRDGVIVEVGPDLASDGERVIDAHGCTVAPGVIDTHTHLEGAMWWNPDVDPLPASGNTSMVFGNCGNSIAPLAGTQRDEIVDLLCFLEDLPVDAFREIVPWTWQTWGEYAEVLRTFPAAVHFGGYVGHLALRTFVMGDAAWERAATDDEVAKMCAVLDEGLRAGAFGLSLNVFDRDRTLRPVPGYFADDAEYRALFGVVAKHRPATVQVLTFFPDHDRNLADAVRFGAIARDTGVRVQWPGLPINSPDDDRRPDYWELFHRLQADGADVWPMLAFKPLVPFLGFERSIAFQRVPAWNEVLNGPAENKLSTLADPVWRDRARSDWDNRTHSSMSRLDRPHELYLAVSETGVGPLGISLLEHSEQTGLHISDALAEWVLANGIGSMLAGAPERHNEADIVRALHEPHMLPNITDSGAHLQLFAAAGEHVYLLTHYVRDTGLISLEHAVHALTGRVAGFFGLHDRGEIAVGRAGDLCVFALDELSLGTEERVHDVPYGSWRFRRTPAGFRATIVAGEPTWIDGAATGARPGGLLRPGVG